MAVQVVNAEGELAMLQGKEAPVRPEIVADNARREAEKAEAKADAKGEKGEKPEAKVEVKAEPKVEPKGDAKAEDANGDDDDDTPAFVKRFGLTEEQNKGVTETFRKEIGKKNLQRKEAEAFAAEQYNERRLAETRAEQLERENRRLQAMLEQGKPQAAADDSEKPKREDFKSDEEHQDAVDNWRVDKKFREREAAEAKRREEERQQQVLNDCAAQVAKAREVIEDFDEVIGSADREVPPHIAAYMQESGMLPELGYHFAKHPDELDRLAKMPTRTALDLQRLGVAIGKIQSTLKPFAPAAKSDDDKPSKTNGAKPTETGHDPIQPRAASAPVIRPLGSGSDSQVEKPASQRSYAEERALFEKKRKLNLTARQRH